MRVVKRKFTACNFPAGSKERADLNKSVETSEFMKSYKFAVIGEGVSLTFRKEDQARSYIVNSKKKEAAK